MNKRPFGSISILDDVKNLVTKRMYIFPEQSSPGNVMITSTPTEIRAVTIQKHFSRSHSALLYGFSDCLYGVI